MGARGARDGLAVPVPRADSRHVRPLVWTVDMHDVYAATHWAGARSPPAYHTPTRTYIFQGATSSSSAKAGVYLRDGETGRLVLGTLAHNPFPDATPEFRTAMGSRAHARPCAPARDRCAVCRVEQGGRVARGATLPIPFELTLSCMNPLVTRGSSLVARNAAENRANERRATRVAAHCGLCSKCRNVTTRSSSWASSIRPSNEDQRTCPCVTSACSRRQWGQLTAGTSAQATPDIETMLTRVADRSISITSVRRSIMCIEKTTVLQLGHLLRGRRLSRSRKSRVCASSGQRSERRDGASRRPRFESMLKINGRVAGERRTGQIVRRA